MAIVTLVVEQNGFPIPGAEVIVGEVIGKSATTNSEGKISKTVGSDFKVSVAIFVRIGGTIRGIFYPMLIEAGNTYRLEIGSTAISV